MITVLDIKDNPPHSLNNKIRSFFVPYSIKTNFNSGKMANVYTVSFIRNRGRIRFDKIYQSCIGKPKTILCNEGVLPENTLLKRFSDTEFQTIMMKNMLNSVLKKADRPGLRIAFYDPFAQFPSLIPVLLKYSHTITVISEMPRFYEIEAERITKETGASIIVNNDISCLATADILAAPCLIDKNIPTHSHEIIFTIQNPTSSCNGTVLFNYKLYIPSETICHIPDNIDESYFAGALYSLCNIKELKHITPYACQSENKLISSEEIIEMIKNAVPSKT